MSFDNHVNVFVFDSSTGIRLTPEEAQHLIEDFINVASQRTNDMALAIKRLRGRVSSYIDDMVDVQLIKRDPESGQVTDSTPEDRTSTIKNLIEDERKLAVQVILQNLNDIRNEADLVYQQLTYTG